jgi:hypothetical protein
MKDSMNNHPATFSIHIIEDADGNVRVISDWSGEGERCLNLGIEIMQSLSAIAPHTNGALLLGMPNRTDILH